MVTISGSPLNDSSSEAEAFLEHISKHGFSAGPEQAVKIEQALGQILLGTFDSNIRRLANINDLELGALKYFVEINDLELDALKYFVESQQKTTS